MTSAKSSDRAAARPIGSRPDRPFRPLPAAVSADRPLTADSTLAGLVAAQTRLARVAARQCGCVTTEQVHESGLGRRRLTAMVDAGHLVRRYTGVYQVALPLAQIAGDPRLAAPGLPREVMAAQLALGRDSCACLETAARLHGLCDPRRWGGAVHMATRPRGKVRCPAPPLLVHHRWIRRSDLTRRGPVRLTTVRRTLADLAGTAPRAEFAPMVAAARRLGLVSAAEARRFLGAAGTAQHPGPRPRAESRAPGARERGAARCRAPLDRRSATQGGGSPPTRRR
ncbi:hypothetical protein HNR23_003432 [Nocardiopsis mwathae]|uniref:AbiEi antitoxin N-terminal domain-containing protein n=1 Tax=Nocardiopsis mwathae TaxID=1472723 RepID=A0A7X0D6C3_9ACTN|nr:type IV toxin-antitoxin system AbiEi family antitoxin domain-containing protein [Nocardiopsis mwathae]MBB6173372.1 hypothetical protein [Nocardiopsis mwathae]